MVAKLSPESNPLPTKYHTDEEGGVVHEVQKAYEDPFIILHNSDLTLLMQKVKPTTVNVYLALHIRANRKAGMSCFPSLSTIASDSNVSRRTVVNAITELEEHGFLTSEQREDEHGDPTSNMYWLHRPGPAKDAQGSAENAPRVVQDLHQGVVQNLHPNHMNLFNTDEIEPQRAERVDWDALFETFWTAYPKKKDKGHARKMWKKKVTSREIFDSVMTSVERYKRSPEWAKDREQFIPYPATWLNGERWDDVIDGKPSGIPSKSPDQMTDLERLKAEYEAYDADKMRDFGAERMRKMYDYQRRIRELEAQEQSA
jgi:predicted transcriptional regulator